MGGDHGASVVLPGADISLTRHPDIEFLLFGDRAVLDPLLQKLPRLKANAKLVHTEVSIRMDDKPSQALRYVPGGLKAARNSGGQTAVAGANQSAVYVVHDGRSVQVPVTVGLDDDSHAEIAKGDLQAGESVIITEQRDGTAGRAATGPRLRF